MFTVQGFGQNETKQDSLSDNVANGRKIIFRDCRTLSEEPLYIVDGTPATSKDFNMINPETIESVSILKPPASSALYGSKASNGAIIIKIKEPEQLSLPMDGTYKIEFTNTSLQKDGYITFNGNSFVMNDDRFNQYSGTINYGNRIISVSSEFDSNIIIAFQASEIGKGIINFEVRNKKAASVNYLHIHSGSLVKIE
jgi:TonB-dependent SusC/RagA subfamily outer membrane receptor